jgi:hypothetical protein
VNGRAALPRGVWWSAAGVVGLLLAVSPRHGFHRDEVYFVAAGRRLDWGFVDQPPLVPLIARLVDSVSPIASPVPLRVLPALAVATVGIVAAATSRRLGGSPRLQVLSAVGVGWVGVLLGQGHLLSTAVFDFLAWSVVLLLVIMLLDGADRRWWVGVGVVLGLGFQNKHTIVALAVALLVALLAYRRSVLGGPWPWVGAAITVAMAAPNVIWQATHGWPQLEMSAALAARSEGPIAFVLQQPLLLSVSMVVPAAVGWWWLWRSPRFRPIAAAYVLLFVVFLVTGGKAYYLAPMASALVPAGMSWFSSRGRLVFGAVGLAIGLFVALPLLPPAAQASFDPTGELGETVGWPELVGQVEGVASGLPANTVVFTGSYGQAGAIELLSDLPVFSGHNSYWWWGPPPEHGPVIGLGPIESTMALFCDDVEQVGTITNPWGVDNEELGNPILLCREPTRQLSEVWAEVRHYN